MAELELGFDAKEDDDFKNYDFCEISDADEVDDNEEEDDDYINDDDDDDDDDHENLETDEIKKKFTILTKEDLLSRIEDDILEVSSLLSIPRNPSRVLLSKYNWDVNALLQEFLIDQERVKKMINSLESSSFSGEEIDKKNINLVRSYAEKRENMKLCPTPGCGCAVECHGKGRNFDVFCKCFVSFCFNCLGEAHSPVDCETVKKWMVKNSSDLETKNWLLAYTKPCPKCKRPIEKINGTTTTNNKISYFNDIITCASPCHCDFCWSCSGSWQEHDKFFGCRAKEEDLNDEVEMERKMAKDLCDYYKKWYSNDLCMERAFVDLSQMKNVNLEILSQIHGINETEMRCIVDAWVQIVECRRVFKWSSVFGYYYLLENEHNKREFFDYMMGQAEDYLEKFQQCADKELSKFLTAEFPLEDFGDFRNKLVRLTGVTRKYFDDLVAALENGLSDVDSHATATSSK
ncbi:hypothetical protein ACH5RR_018915 [Cinchona calisaya]|uniref:RBR-type E3 ubiquitin transferase n=1 Tax=Cinchona calisaya TaxID=153742 RepID=A0ABD2ZPI0_9GENT